MRAIAADLFGIPEHTIHSDSSPETVEGWDSLQHLNLILAIEERFGVSLSPEEMDEMRSIGKVSDVVERKLQAVSESAAQK